MTGRWLRCRDGGASPRRRCFCPPEMPGHLGAVPRRRYRRPVARYPSGHPMLSRPVLSMTLLAGLLGLAACSKTSPQTTEPYYSGIYGPGGLQGTGSVLGDQGAVFGTGATNRGSGDIGGGALGVNAYLWRGALDTLSFMPLASA